MVGAKPTGPIKEIHELPIFSTLWNLQLQLVGDLQKLGNVKYPLVGHARYILSKEVSALILNKEWTGPEGVGEYFEIQATLIT